MKGTWESFFALSSREDAVRTQLSKNEEAGLTRCRICSALVWDVPVSRDERSKPLLSVSHPVHSVLLLQPS